MSRLTECTAIQARELSCPLDGLVAFESLRRQPYGWWLDSASAPAVSEPRLARYSFAGSDPYLVLRSFGSQSELEWRRRIRPGLEATNEHIEGDPLAVLQSLLPEAPAIQGSDFFEQDAVPPFLGGAVGTLGYELAQQFEHIELCAPDDLALPDLVMLFVDRLLVIDHQRERAFAVGLGFAQCPHAALEFAEAAAQQLAAELDVENREVGPVRAPRDLHATGARRDRLLGAELPREARGSLSAGAYLAAVESIREQIACGNVYQTNLTQRFELDAGSAGGDADRSWALYRGLRELNPAPFAAYLELPEATILSSSPERFLSLDTERRAESRPIKGTRPRGRTRDDDACFAKELAESTKDRAENLMIVDLVRNDLGRVCETGSVEVPELSAIESYATVFQMVSTVRGRLREDCDATDLVRACFPPGSMTGAPKIAAMGVIDSLETVRRGVYAGAIGYFDARGGLDLSVVIRTLLLCKGRLYLHSGGAIVSDSVPQDEYCESLDKIRALLTAVEEWRQEPVPR